jgi:hypothetical protein
MLQGPRRKRSLSPDTMKRARCHPAFEHSIIVGVFLHNEAATPITLAAWLLLAPGFSYEMGNIFLAQAEGAGAFFTVGEDPLPTPVSEVTLDRLAEHFLDRTLLLVRRCLNFRDERGWDGDGVVFNAWLQ